MMANAKVRPGYYGHQPVPPVTEDEEPQPVEGADAIAAVVKLKPRQVYNMLEAMRRGRIKPADALPVRKVPGVGLVGDRRDLIRWYDRYIRGRSAA